MRTNFYKTCALILCLMMAFCTSTAFAATTTLMSYNGKGIRSKDSVDTFTLSKQTEIHLSHKTTAVDYNGVQPDDKCILTVSLLRKGGLSYSATGDQITATGITSKAATWTKSSGTYRLHFETKAHTESWWPGATIEGRIYTK